MQILHPFLERESLNGRYVTTEKGRLAKELQKTVGDVMMNAENGKIYGVEIKAEQIDKYGNFFLESWSNLKWYTPGWMFTLDADVLLYHFLESDDLYVINFQRLREWAFKQGHFYRFPERKQSKYDQLNDTWGRCVPIEVISQQVGLKLRHPAEESLLCADRVPE